MQAVPRSLSSHVVSCLFANFNSIGARFGPANPASTKTIPLQSSPSRTLRSCSSNTNLNIESKIVSKTLQQNEKMENKPDQQRKEHRSSNSTTTATINSNPDVNRMQEILRSDSSDGWEKCWDQGLTPWDLGQPTPVMVHLHQTGALPNGRALVPGCGSGHDVVAIACPERYVVGVDKSDKAIMKAIELSSSLQNADYFTFLKADIFTWKPTELFDLIFDYTFFCAIEPDMRSAWASQMQYLLKPDGELITLMFPISDHVGGPPYKVSITDYEEVLHPMGFKAASIVENDLAINPRKGREKLGRWKKFTHQSSL